MHSVAALETDAKPQKKKVLLFFPSNQGRVGDLDAEEKWGWNEWKTQVMFIIDLTPWDQQTIKNSWGKWFVNIFLM